MQGNHRAEEELVVALGLHLPNATAFGLSWLCPSLGQARKVNETSEEQGYCECQGMWGGDYCAECVRGYAGPDCQDQCPELCGGRGTCSNDNGTLVRRQAGRQ